MKKNRRVHTVSRGLMLICLTLIFLQLSADSTPARAGQWLQLRGDRQMSGRAAGVGRVSETGPVEAWRFDIAAWEGYLAVDPSQAARRIDLPFPDQVDLGEVGDVSKPWSVGPQAFDLSSDGALVSMPVDNVFKVAKILDEVEGLQRFEMGNSFADAGVEPTRGTLIAYDGGGPRVVWETEEFRDTWDPNVLVVDVDADGQLDIAVATHYRVLVFDGATGATKMQLQYHGFRNYGWFGAANIDADPYPEFAVIADFSMHAEVIDNDGSNLSLVWLREIQPEVSQSTKIVRPGPRNLVDTDGDGRLELAYGIYNDAGDSQWHVVTVDALSGDTLHDYPGHYLHGMADLDGDSQVELFVSAVAGEALPTYAPLEVWTLGAGGPVVRWQLPYGRFSTRKLASLPLSASTGAADGLRTVATGDVDGDGRADFFVAEPKAEAEVVRALSLAAGEASELWSVRGPPGGVLEVAAVAEADGDPEIETLIQIRGRGAAEAVDLEGIGGRLLAWTRQGSTPAGTPVVADLDGDGAVEVVIQTGTQEVVCLQAPRLPGEEPQVRWRMAGYGQTNNAPFHWGVVAADLQLDGDLEVLFARETPEGDAGLAAVSAKGDVRWHTRFAGFDGTMPIWNFSGLSYWGAGHFRSTDQLDVFATLRRGKLGSEVGFLLDGSSGEIAWESSGYALEKGGARSLGGHPSAAGDLDGDGLEEIIVMWPDRLHVIDGVTGSAQVVRAAYGVGLNPMFESDGFVGYAFPAVVDLVGDATPELIWGHNTYLNAVLDAGGATIWQTDYLNNTNVPSLMDVGDAAGDGDLELLASTPGGPQLLDPVDGALLLELTTVGTAHTDVVSGDVDGDGRDEFLFGGSNLVLCLEVEEGVLQVAWRLDVGARASDLALADVNADGFLDLVVTTTDGYVKAYFDELPTAVEDEHTVLPAAARLRQPYPNPFNSSVNIPFSLAARERVKLELFDLVGQRIALLVDALRAAGDHQVRWQHAGIASGVYLVRMRVGDYVEERRITLAK